MYLAIQLVRRGEEEGINAFLHKHPPDLKWPKSPEDIAALADVNPGKIVQQRTDLKPGGNAVRAYLDVLAPEDTAVEDIEKVIQTLRRKLAEQKNPTIFSKSVVALRFGVELSLERLRDLHLDMLSSVGLQLLRSGHQGKRARSR